MILVILLNMVNLAILVNLVILVDLVIIAERVLLFIALITMGHQCLCTCNRKVAQVGQKRLAVSSMVLGLV